MPEEPNPSNSLDPADFELKIREIIDNRVIIDIRGYTTRNPSQNKGCQPTTRNMVAGFVHFENDQATLYLEASPHSPTDDLRHRLERQRDYTRK